MDRAGTEAGTAVAEDRRVTPEDAVDLADALADCVTKAVEYGEQDGGFVAMYLLPTGPIHRAIPLLERLGITVRPGFDGRAKKGRA